MVNLQNKIIFIKWIKAHVGTKGNERADQLAKEVIIHKYDKILDIKYPKSLLKRFFKNKIQDEWQLSWENSDKGRNTFEIINKVDKNYLCKNQVVTYFLTGHGSFPSFLYKIKKKETDCCTCGKRGNPFHYLFESCTLVGKKF